MGNILAKRQVEGYIYVNTLNGIYKIEIQKKVEKLIDRAEKVHRLSKVYKCIDMVDKSIEDIAAYYSTPCNVEVIDLSERGEFRQLFEMKILSNPENPFDAMNIEDLRKIAGIDDDFDEDYLS